MKNMHLSAENKYNIGGNWHYLVVNVDNRDILSVFHYSGDPAWNLDNPGQTVYVVIVCVPMLQVRNKGSCSEATVS